MMAAHELNDGVELFYRNVDFNTYGFLNATEDFITNNADLAQVVADAYEKARAWALENPDETAQLLADVSGLDLEVATVVLLERTVIDLDFAPGAAQYSARPPSRLMPSISKRSQSWVGPLLRHTAHWPQTT